MPQAEEVYDEPYELAARNVKTPKSRFMRAFWDSHVRTWSREFALDVLRAYHHGFQNARAGVVARGQAFTAREHAYRAGYEIVTPSRYSLKYR